MLIKYNSKNSQKFAYLHNCENIQKFEYFGSQISLNSPDKTCLQAFL